jgi:FdhD protein
MPTSEGWNTAPDATVAVPILRAHCNGFASETDVLAVEEPLEIRVGFDDEARRVHRGVSITMRTPGNDHELAVGFLFTEGLITERAQFASAKVCQGNNVVRVELSSGVTLDLSRLERHFYTGSSCGVCGKASLDAVRVEPRCRPAAGQPVVEAEVIHQLPDILRASQVVFDRTGGLHACALFNSTGQLLSLREDVGRHNALDKLIGAEFLGGRVPLSQSILLVSGRLSFELVQKAAVAGIPVLVAVGAPSSLAVDLANDYGLTTIGFVRANSFNIYTGAERIRFVPAAVAGLVEKAPLSPSLTIIHPERPH